MNLWPYRESNRLIRNIDYFTNQSINIRLTIYARPNFAGILYFTENIEEIEEHLIPKLKKDFLYNLFIEEFTEDWKGHKLDEICKYILKLIYLE